MRGSIYYLRGFTGPEHRPGVSVVPQEFSGDVYSCQKVCRESVETVSCVSFGLHSMLTSIRPLDLDQVAELK